MASGRSTPVTIRRGKPEQPPEGPALRLLSCNGRPSPRSRRPSIRTIAVLSGRGGVGKSTLVANLGIAMRRRGLSVLLVDGDLGMSGLDPLLGVEPTGCTSQDIVRGTRRASEVVVRTREDVTLLPAAPGVEEMANLDELSCERLYRSLHEIEDETDLILLDTAAGLGRTTMHFARCASERILVTTPEPAAFTSAYAILRALGYAAAHDGGGAHRPASPPPPYLVVNQAHDAEEGASVARRIRDVARRFLSIDPVYLGCIPVDGAVGSAVRRQEPLLRLYPRCAASLSIEELAARLLESGDPDPGVMPVPGWSFGARNGRERERERIPA
ncbi:MAG: MinD/ParA family protein [Candidatus Eisenbacteria bacterium]